MLTITFTETNTKKKLINIKTICSEGTSETPAPTRQIGKSAKLTNSFPIFLLPNLTVGGNCVFALHQYVGSYSVGAISLADDAK